MSEARVVAVACPNPKCPARMKVKTRQAEKVIACPQCGTNVVVSATPVATSVRGPVSAPAPAVVEAETSLSGEQAPNLLIAIAIGVGVLVLVVGVLAAVILIEVVAQVVVAILCVLFVGCVWYCIQASGHIVFGLGDGNFEERFGELVGAALTGVLLIGLAFGLAWASGVANGLW